MRSLVFAFLCLLPAFECPAQEVSDNPTKGVPVSYRLPTTGSLPQTYRVTLAIVDAKNPDWIISQFAAGVARTVTAENGGTFAEIWNGLDDNFMPVPPGTYAVKGIYMPAAKWDVDDEYHSIVPRYITSADAWRPMPGENREPILTSDPVNSPIGDVDIGANGVGVFCYSYLEIVRNYFIADFNKPVNYEQVTGYYGSGGTGGAQTIATDGITSWAFADEGFVFRTDRKPFGQSESRYFHHSYLPEGHITAMAAWRDNAAGRSFIYLAERGRMLEPLPKSINRRESNTEMTNKIVVLDGDSAEVKAELNVAGPIGIVARWGDRLWVLHRDGEGYAVSAAPLMAGIPAPHLTRVFAVPRGILPSDLEVDSHGRIYIADAGVNKVHQFSTSGVELRVLGRLSAQRPGTYDPESFMSPEKLACWRDAAGHDRLVIVERHGPQRVSEWSADDGNRLREWLSAQTFANTGYAVDPRQTDRFYIQGHGGWLTRFRVNYATGEWKVEAVWPDVCTGWFHDEHYGFPRMIYRGEQRYLAFGRGQFLYREDGNRWLPSAAILAQGTGNEKKHYIWNDANGDGKVQENEYVPYPTNPPPGTLRYWGETWLDDLSLVAIQGGTADVWRLAPEDFDAHGNPIYNPKGWKKLLTDPILTARQQGNATATFGGNETTNAFNNDWSLVEGSMSTGFYVNHRGLPNIGANFGGQQKLSRYVPDGKGGYRLLWRVCRAAINGIAEPGEVYGSFHLTPPIGGLVAQVDQTRMGLLLYNEEGLYVDTLLPDERKVDRKKAGPYTQPGEYFTGYAFANTTDGKVILALGKTTPMLFEAVGWTGTANPVRHLDTVQKAVTLSAAQTARPPEVALSYRGGAGTAKVVRFAPAMGEVALDGAISGWESCEPVKFQADKDETIEVRCLYRPDQLLLRWHARSANKFVPKPLHAAEQIFTHEHPADTFSFYFQGDPDAAPNGRTEGRPGDVRFVFGIFSTQNNVRPLALGMYPAWPKGKKASPKTYKSPVGTASFAHVGPVEGAQLHHRMDEDGRGFVLTAVLPRTAIPHLTKQFGSDLNTLVNFEATFGGHNKFWWANSDGSASRETYNEPTEARLYPGSWAAAQFRGFEEGVTVRNWLTCGPFGGTGTERFIQDPNGYISGTKTDMKLAVVEFCEAGKYPPDDGKVKLDAIYAGDMIRGYWPDPREVRWKPATIADLDTRVKLGDGGQVWYGATWIHSPSDTELDFHFQSHFNQTHIRWFLNGERLQIQTADYVVQKNAKIPTATRTLKLHAGWNQVMFRAYCTGYAPFLVGLSLSASPENLWPLKLSAQPPESAVR